MYAEADGAVVVDLGTQVLRLAAGDPRAAVLAAHHSARLVLGIRSDAVTLVDPGTERDDVLRGTVRLVEDLGHEVVVHVDTGAMPVARATTRLGLPEPEVDLARLLGDEPPAARTEYGFYPRYEPANPGRDARGDVLLRIARPAPVPRLGEAVGLGVDLDRMYLFDGAGERVRLGPA